MMPSSLRKRIRNGGLLMLLIALGLGAVALPKVYRLGGAIRQTLYNNYISIEAAQHMHTALYALQLAQRDGTLAAALPANRDTFRHWIDVELNHITEAGEAALAADIERRGRRLFDGIGALSPPQNDGEFSQLHGRLDQLIKMNQAAMFRADSRASQLSTRLAVAFGTGLLLFLVIGGALAWTLAWKISQPLTELADRLRNLSLKGPSLRLGKQPLAELATVAAEFNKMAERLEQFEKLNVERLIYEKSKTEAIIESIEDGIVLIDPQGIVTHINEIAGIIMGIEREEALGSPFDDLNSNHPHYLRVRDALRSAAATPGDSPRIEVDLHVRGRDHTYVLKAVPLRHTDGQALGTILILQNITYLRDQDRARVNLVATLSHELKTPLTSLALSAGLLERSKDDLKPKAQELLASISEDIGRIRRLAEDLLDLARGSSRMITIRNLEIDLCQLIRMVLKTFRLQADEKHVVLSTNASESIPKIHGDPIKLFWAVSNLIANALRYTPAGGSISISSEHVAN
ncbi:MAG TPA: histidine kinase dimerization/phospho-acceptor domain-containing protein, partial [Candidatus Acidoferrales bacterium]|nr:histidine kinase dimerization/phospho-acceptor domain-containing protein [Candidatus Acidoferrales bacterium]